MNIAPKSLNVCLVGATGNMGRAALRALLDTEDLKISAAVSRSRTGCSLQEFLGSSAPNILLEQDLPTALYEKPIDVVLDLTHPDCVARHVDLALEYQIPIVVGASGLKESDFKKIRRESLKQNTPVFWVPNFSIGAVLMMQFAKQAAKWMPEVEIVEMHRSEKADAPSGTAIRTADLIAEARKQEVCERHEIILVDGVRGGQRNSIPIHSVRMQGLLAHQLVLFGGQGQTLTIRHDSLDRSCFMEGIKLALRTVSSLKGLVIGLENVL